jgi:hypothetical protein
MVRWVGHVACAGEVKGICRMGSMEGRAHFGDVDFGGSLIQRRTNAEKCVRIHLNEGFLEENGEGLCHEDRTSLSS